MGVKNGSGEKMHLFGRVRGRDVRVIRLSTRSDKSLIVVSPERGGASFSVAPEDLVLEMCLGDTGQNVKVFLDTITVQDGGRFTVECQIKKKRVVNPRQRVALSKLDPVYDRATTELMRLASHVARGAEASS